MGSGENGQLTFLDFITLISFWVGLINLEENMTQGDKQDLMKKFDEQTEAVLGQIHAHLEGQDKKIDRIMTILEGGNNGDIQGL